MKKYFLTLSIFLSLFMLACTQKVHIQALEPAEIDRVTKIKKIAVIGFKNDTVGLSSKIESNLASFKIENKSFFTMISRSDIHQIIKEQKIQNSGLVDTQDIVEVGSLMGAKALISGRVNRVGLSDTHYYETKVKCADKKCKKTYDYDVRCTKRIISLSADIKIVDIQRGDIIYADNLSKEEKFTHCSDDYRSLPSKASVVNQLASSIANDFTHRLTPHYTYFEVELLEKPDLDYNDEQELLLKNSLKYIKHNRYLKADKLLIELINSTAQQSYVAFYNLGVVKEAQGDYEKALSYYKKADNLTSKPVEIIDVAYLRIISIIQNHKITKQQMDR